MKNKTAAYIAIFAGLVLVSLSVMYWTVPAGSLPHFMPGYISDSAVIHVKHGVAAFVLALALFVYAWFHTGKKSSARNTEVK